MSLQSIDHNIDLACAGFPDAAASSILASPTARISLQELQQHNQTWLLYMLVLITPDQACLLCQMHENESLLPFLLLGQDSHGKHTLHHCT